MISIVPVAKKWSMKRLRRQNAQVQSMEIGKGLSYMPVHFLFSFFFSSQDYKSKFVFYFRSLQKFAPCWQCWK